MTNGSAQPALRLQGLAKSYPGFQLGPFDLDLEPGRVLGFVGPNGAGKTTTFHCATGLVRPDSGRVEIFGRANDPRDTSWRPDLGHVGEVSGLYEDWTGEQNLGLVGRFQPGWSSRRASDLAERFHLPLDRKVKELSKGNRAKLALVAALGHSPRLLLLDEPTAGLDPVVRSEVLDVLWEVLEDGEHSIFYSTHIISDISRLADELVFIHDGRILARHATTDMVESWRRITFRLAAADLSLVGIAEHKRLRDEHQVVSFACAATLRQLGELGAERIEHSPMTIEEIAVMILKGGRHAQAL